MGSLLRLSRRADLYLKAILSRDRRQACVLELRYPPANKLELDFIVSRISKSLRLPRVRRRGTLVARQHPC